MIDPDSPEMSILLGDFYENAVKKGIARQLLLMKNVDEDHKSLAHIKGKTVGGYKKNLLNQLNTESVENLHPILNSLNVQGFLAGTTAIRNLQRKALKMKLKENGSGTFPSKRVFLEGAWLPIEHKDRTAYTKQSPDVDSFSQAMGIVPPEDRYSGDGTGHPLNADVLLLFRKGEEFHLLAAEISLAVPPQAGLESFAKQGPHLKEVEKLAAWLEYRGAFSDIGTDITSASQEGMNFQIDESFAKRISCLTTRDKPLYKLFQASSYSTELARFLLEQGHIGSKKLYVYAMAITNVGYETIQSKYELKGANCVYVDSWGDVMEKMGSAYRSWKNRRCDNIRKELLRPLAKKLPKGDSQNIKSDDFRNAILELGNSSSQNLVEVLYQSRKEGQEGFANPDTKISWSFWEKEILKNPEVTDFRIKDIRNKAQESGADKDKFNFRQVHSAAIKSYLHSAVDKKLTILSLLAAPGSGKTTTISQSLKDGMSGADKGIFFYFSPRVQINNEVVNKLADKKNSALITTNSKLNSGIATWKKENPHDEHAPARNVRAAVRLCGDWEDCEKNCKEKCKIPENEICYLPRQKAEHVEKWGKSVNKGVQDYDEHNQKTKQELYPGVFKTLAQSCRDIIAKNQQLEGVVVTAAIQGLKRVAKRNTIDSLSSFFNVSYDAGQKTENRLDEIIKERRKLAERFPNIWVMLDEVTGDEAGVTLVHEMADWLKQQFVQPFWDRDETSPFSIVLIVADATLTDPRSFHNHIGLEETPRRVIVSSNPGQAFGVAESKIRLRKVWWSVCHVMGNIYPAKDLTLEYRIGNHEIDLHEDYEILHKKGVRGVIRDHVDSRIKQESANNIVEILQQGERQVLFFAQDKEFLNELSNLLPKIAKEQELTILQRNGEIAVVHSSVAEEKRYEILKRSKFKDQAPRVVLMTSASSRGVDFPLASSIVVLVPRFAMEQALMEITQLIFRGRGKYGESSGSNERKSGDNFSRRLRFMLDDFFLKDGFDPEQRTPEELEYKITRRTMDLATLVMTLRGAVHSRIRGHAGLKGFSVSLVPVGGIDISGMGQMLSADFMGLLNQLRSVKMNSESGKDLSGMCESLGRRIKKCLTNLDFKNVTDRKSAANRDELEKFRERVNKNGAPALDAHPELSLADKGSCLGPVWIESWIESKAEENFKSLSWRTESKEICKGLKSLYKREGLPKDLANYIRSAIEIFCSGGDTEQKTTSNQINSGEKVFVVPINYPEFVPDTEKSRENVDWRLKDPDEWYKRLQTISGANVGAKISPVIMEYKDKPFLIIEGDKDPARLERLFDEHVMMSREMNLLNMIFVKNTEREGGELRP